MKGKLLTYEQLLSMNNIEVLVDIAKEKSISPIVMTVCASKIDTWFIHLKAKDGLYAYGFPDGKLINKGSWIDIYENII